MGFFRIKSAVTEALCAERETNVDRFVSCFQLEIFDWQTAKSLLKNTSILCSLCRVGSVFHDTSNKHSCFFRLDETWTLFPVVRCQTYIYTCKLIWTTWTVLELNYILCSFFRFTTSIFNISLCLSL